VCFCSCLCSVLSDFTYSSVLSMKK
jgi:hypothetical protein